MHPQIQKLGSNGSPSGLSTDWNDVSCHEMGDLYEFKFSFPTDLPGEMLGCVNDEEKQILLDRDPSLTANNKRLNLLTALLLRVCLTTSVALHYKEILPELLTRCMDVRNLASSNPDLEFHCDRHDLYIKETFDANVDLHSSGICEAERSLEECYIFDINTPGEDGRSVKGADLDTRVGIYWGFLVICLGELVPYVPHLIPFAIKALEMTHIFHSYIEMAKRSSNHSCMLERFLRALFRLFSHSAARFSRCIQSSIFLDFLPSENPMIRSYAIYCFTYIEGWSDGTRQNLLRRYESPLYNVNPLRYYSPSTYELKLNDYLCNRTFSNSIRRSKLPNFDRNEVPLNKELLSSGLVDISGVLLSKSSNMVGTSLVGSKFCEITSRRKYMHQFAMAVSVGDSILLEGKPGSGKTSLTEYIASRMSVKRLFKLVLNDQSDPKTLIGTYVCSSKPGIFEWKPGILTVAVREGSWILVENIDSAPVDVISIFSSLLESKYLYIPNRAEKITAKSGFQIIATCTDSSQLRVSKNCWHQIYLPDLTSSDIQFIVENTYGYLGPYSSMLIKAYNYAVEAYSKPYTHYGRKIIMPRDLFKLCNRLDLFLKYKIANGISLLDKEFCITAFECTFDCFFRSFFSPSDKIECRRGLAQIYGLDSESYSSSDGYHSIMDTSQNYLTEEELNKIVENSFSACETFELTATTRRNIRMIYACCMHSEPILMVGETGTGKTTIIQALARILNKKLTVINMSRETELSDLLGGFKPVSEHKILYEIYENFKTLFSNTFNPRSNIGFINVMESAMLRKNFKHVTKGFRKAIAAAEVFYKHRKSEDASNHTKVPCMDPNDESINLPRDWQAFENSVNEFERIINSNTPMRFHFVNGCLSKAIVEGGYVLLDEINLASKETLDHISAIIESNNDSITLMDTGNVAPLPRSPKFRLFACMNPSSDFGKKELDVIFRSRFTEFWIDSPADNIDELRSIVRSYLRFCLVPEKKESDAIVNDISNFYMEVTSLSRDALISDASGSTPNFSPRTLFRALSFTSQIIPYCNIYRAIYEGMCLCFLSCLDGKSSEIVHRLLGDKYTCAARNSVEMKHPHYNTPKTNKQNKDYVKVGAFWLETGPLPRNDDEAEKFIVTPSVELNLLNLSRAVACGKHPILIQGPTSVGKTSMIEFLARKLGHKFVRINNHQHTEIQEYIGSWAPTSESGKLEFVDGALLRSLKNGHWLVLDELNMAPSDVIEALDRLLDENKELFVAETQTVVKPHPNFMLFATQNPAGLYDGRNYLSRSLRNRFLELHFGEVPTDELSNILSERCGVAPSFVNKMVNVYKRLQQLRSEGNIFEGRQSYVTLRDLFKWANRNASSYEELAINGWFIIGERARRSGDRAIVKQILEEEISVTPLDLSIIYRNYTEKVINNSLDKLRSLDNSIAFTDFFCRMFTLVYNCVTNNEPVLLVGETGVGKTTLCQLISQVLGRDFYVVNAHQGSTAQDFIGGQRPVRSRSLLIDEIKSNISQIFTELNIEEGPIETLETWVNKAFNTIKKTLYKHPNERIDLILNKTEDMWKKSKQMFCWCDGPLVKAMEGGGIMLIDEISLADSSIIERLNSVLEPERSLVLAEKSCPDGICTVNAADGFCIFATMNPGGDHGKKELSPALRSRFTEIWVPVVDSKSDMAIIIESRLGCDFEYDPSIKKSISSWILSFVSWLSTLLNKSESEISSIRDLITWAQFICRTHHSLGLKKAFIHGGCLVFLDGMRANSKFGSYSISGAVNNDKADDFNVICKKKLSSIVQEDWSDPDKSFEIVQNVDNAQQSSSLEITPFTINVGPVPRALEYGFSLKAPTTILNLGRIMRALQLDKPILIEGPPGVGKTSLVMALASIAGYEFTRINLSDQTDIMDLFGSDLPKEDDNSGCSFSWHDGPFLHAMKSGNWVLLDELNLADQNVLEGLNSCLDHRQEVYIPDLDAVFKKSSGFRIFAAQNPYSLGGGRKGLPKSFIDRFTVVHVDKMPLEDEEIIVEVIFGNRKVESDANTSINNNTLVNMCRFNNSVARKVSELRIGATMGNPEFNLRDIVRWAKLMQIDSNHYDPEKYLRMLYLHRLRSYDDRILVKKLFEEIFGYKVRDSTFKSQFTVNTTHVRIGNAIYDRLDNVLPPGKSFEHLQIFSSKLAYLESLLKCIQANYLPLLVGPEDCGKTSSLRLLARVCGRNLIEVPLCPSTDISDLLGSFEQVSQAKHEEEFRQDFDLFTKHIIWRSLQSNGVIPNSVISIVATVQELERITHDSIDKVDKAISSLNMHTSTEEFLNDPIYIQKLRALTSSFKRLISSLELNEHQGRFSWVDGPVTKAMKEGQWIVLENANLCSPSILDRLNPIFEPGGTLILSERGPKNGKFEVVDMNKNFRIFMTMDSKYGELSRAMRNRSVEIYMSQDIVDMEHEDSIIINDIARLQKAECISHNAAKFVRCLYGHICNETRIKCNYFSRSFIKFNKVFCNLVNRGGGWNSSLIHALEYLNIREGVDTLNVTTFSNQINLLEETGSYPIFREYLDNSEITSSSRFFSVIENATTRKKTNGSVVDLYRVYRAACSFLYSSIFKFDHISKWICESLEHHSCARRFLECLYDEDSYVGKRLLKSPDMENRLKHILKVLGISNVYGEYHYILDLDDLQNIDEYNIPKVHLLGSMLTENTLSSISLDEDSVFDTSLDVKKLSKGISTICELLIKYTNSAIDCHDVKLSNHIEDFVQFLEGLSDMCLIVSRLNVAITIIFLNKVVEFVNNTQELVEKTKSMSSLLYTINDLGQSLNFKYFDNFFSFWKELYVYENKHYNGNLDAKLNIHKKVHKFYNYLCPCSFIHPEGKCKVIMPTLSPTAPVTSGNNQYNINIHTQSNVRLDADDSCSLELAKSKMLFLPDETYDKRALDFPELRLGLLFSEDTVVKLVTLPLYDYLSLLRESSLIEAILISCLNDICKSSDLKATVSDLVDILPHSSKDVSGIDSLFKLLEFEHCDKRSYRRQCRNVILNWYMFNDSNAFTTLYGDTSKLYTAGGSDELFARIISGIYHEADNLSTIADYHTAIRCIEATMCKDIYKHVQLNFLPHTVIAFFFNDILIPFCNKDQMCSVNEAFLEIVSGRDPGNKVEILYQIISTIPHESDVAYCLEKALNAMCSQYNSMMNSQSEAMIGIALMYVSYAIVCIFMSGFTFDPVDVVMCEIQVLERQIESLMVKKEFLMELYNSYLVSSTKSSKMFRLKSSIESKKQLIESLSQSKACANRSCEKDITRNLYNELTRLKYTLSIGTVDKWISMLQDTGKRYDSSIKDIINQKIVSLQPYIDTHMDIVEPIITALHGIKYATGLISSNEGHKTSDNDLITLLFNSQCINLEDLNIDDFKKKISSVEMSKIIKVTDGLCLAPLLHRAVASLIISGVSVTSILPKINFVVSYIAQTWTGCERKRAAESLRKLSIYKIDTHDSDENNDSLEEELPCGRGDNCCYGQSLDDSGIMKNGTGNSTSQNSTNATEVRFDKLIDLLYALYQTYVNACTDLGTLDVAKFSELWEASIYESCKLSMKCMRSNADYRHNSNGINDIILIWGSKMLEDINSNVKPTDIYKDPYVSEVKKVRPFCVNAHQRLLELLGKWPMHDTLMKIYGILRKLLSFPMTTPLPRILYTIMEFLCRVEDWEKYASMEDSLTDIINEACKLIDSLRRIELEHWKFSLHMEERRYETSFIQKVWLYLWSSLDYAVTDPSALNDLVQTLNDYMSNSTLGDFSIRLKSIDICIRSFRNSNSDMVNRILVNTYKFYSEFWEFINENICRRRKSMHDKLKIRISLNHLRNVVYYSIREAYDNENRKLLRILKEYRQMLSCQTQGLLSDYILKDLSKFVCSENLKLPDCKKISKEQNVNENETYKIMWKLLHEKFFVLKFNIDTQVKTLILEVEKYVENYNCKEARFCKDENTYNKKRELRRVHLHRLFKELKCAGIPFRDIYCAKPETIGMQKIFLMQYANSPGCEDLLKGDYHFITYAKTEKLKALHPTAHSDLTRRDSKLCLGFMQNILNIKVAIRKALLKSAQKFYALKAIMNRINTTANSDTIYVCKFNDLLTVVNRFKEYVDTASIQVSRNALIRKRSDNLGSRSNIPSILDNVKVTKSNIDSIYLRITESRLGLITSDEVRSIREAANSLKQIFSELLFNKLDMRPNDISCLHRLDTEIQNFSYTTLENFLLEHCIISGNHGNNSRNLSYNDNASVFLSEFKKSVLTSIQSILDDQSDLDSIGLRNFQLQISERLPKLVIDSISNQLENLLQVTQLRTLKTNTESYLSEYTYSLEVAHNHISRCYKAISLLSLSLSNLFLCLYVNGFNLELQIEEQQDQCDDTKMGEGVISGETSANNQDSKFKGEMEEFDRENNAMNDNLSDAQDDAEVSDYSSFMSLDMSSDGGKLDDMSSDGDMNSNISDRQGGVDSSDLDFNPEPYNEALWEGSVKSEENGKDESKCTSNDVDDKQKSYETSKKLAPSDDKLEEPDARPHQKEDNVNEHATEYLSDGDFNDLKGPDETEVCDNLRGEKEEVELTNQDNPDPNTDVHTDDNVNTEAEDCRDPSVTDEKNSYEDKDSCCENDETQVECTEHDDLRENVSIGSDMCLNEAMDQYPKSNEDTNSDVAEDANAKYLDNNTEHRNYDNQEMEPGFNGDITSGDAEMCKNKENTLDKEQNCYNNDDIVTPLQEQYEGSNNDCVLDAPNNEVSMRGAAVGNRNFNNNTSSSRKAPDRDRIRAHELNNLTNNAEDACRQNKESNFNADLPMNTNTNFEFMKNVTEDIEYGAQAYAEAFNDQINKENFQPSKEPLSELENMPIDSRECVSDEETNPGHSNVYSNQKQVTDALEKTKINGDLDEIKSSSSQNELSDAYEYEYDRIRKKDHHMDTVDGVSDESDEPYDRYDTLCLELISCDVNQTNECDIQRLKLASELWNMYTNQTLSQVARLAEQLQLLLKPSLANKLKGDYKTGKRLNMRRLIPYIASSYRKDRIWLRRTQPNKRCYQVMLCIDDSLSMNEKKCVQLAYKSLVVISRAFHISEIGDIGVISFGETLKLLHPFGRPITDEAGAKILAQFTFNQSRTLMVRMMDTALKIFKQSRYLIRHSGPSLDSLDLKRLQIIISDGICEDHEKLRSLCRLGKDIGLMTAFIILDTKSGDESIRNIKNIVYTNTKSSMPPSFTIGSYMETFPFDYFVIINKVEMLPDVLSDVIRQYIELSS